ncbi:major capsid protein, partial [Herbiconiux daphne]
TNLVALVAHRSALGTVKLKDLSLERARRSEYQADAIIGKYAMGHGVLRPEACGALVVAKP